MKKDILEQFVQEILESRDINRDGLDAFKRKLSKKYKVDCPKNVALLKTYHKLVKEKTQEYNPEIEVLLRTRPVRSLSGIVNVSILTKPYPCPGECIFCPTEKDIPKSYLKNEPAVQRAILNNYSPSKQIKTRLTSLQQTGHPIDKIELRIIGGTWSYYKKAYQEWFIKESIRTCNEFNKNNSSKKQNLKQLQKQNETAKARIVGITVETRPDYIDIEEIERMRTLGITRVELGVQSIYNNVLKLNKRGHNVDATIQATKLLKNAGFKVSYQIMPNLPGSNFKKDVTMFKEIFTNPDFMPDLLKIYPLALVKNCPLYKIYKQGKYKPYSKVQLAKLLIEIKKQIPNWCRVERIIRDIPAIQIIEGGTKTSNLREVVQKQMKEQGIQCQCIRCKEVGNNYNPKEKLYLFRKDYNASGGKEIFLSFENKKRTLLYSMLRLRLPKELSSFGVLKNASIIREVHTYGQMTSIGSTSSSSQHKGLGKKLIKEAERITKKEFKLKKIAIIASVGTRKYYSSKLQYRLKNTYMVKELK
ncbi:MAG: tRNA uridine(34) 5-carboxymethylaminomethyl modification radical SAM/GNAT enzyme Elp3 [Parcubacteria group bacterium]|nr:tRNA uridine(34) 5-carboxymethylaminomethyl modification radical SAM/GNAT enzyme Elp3 [Parcubacteria group bacterium]